MELRCRGFPAQLGEPFDPIGVEPREVPGIDPRLQQKRDFLERLDDLRRRVGRGVAPEPMKAGTAGLGLRLEEAGQPGVLVSRDEWSQTAPRLVVRLLARSSNESCEPCESGAHNILPMELIAGQLEQ